MSLNASRSGIALVVTVLVTAVVVVTVLATASVVTIGVRRGTSDEARSYRALLLAESAMNVARATVAAQQFDADEFDTASNPDARVAFNAFLSQAASAAAAGGAGTVTPSSFPISGGSGVAIEMAATVGGANARVLLDFTVDQLQGVLSLNAPAALTSIPRITVSGDARVSGVDDSEANWVRDLGQTPNAWSFTGSGSTVVTTSTSMAGAVQAGEYVAATVQGVREVFRVDSAPPADGLGENQLELTRVTPGASGSLTVLANTFIDHRPFAVTDEVVVPPTANATVSVPVTYPDFYRANDTLTVTGSVNGLPQTATFTVDAVEDNGVATTGLPAGFVVDEGTTVRRSVIGAYTNSSITENGGGVVLGGKVENPTGDALLVREQLFERTFGASMATVEDLARRAGTYYSTWEQVPTQDGATWVDGITFVGSNTSNQKKFCGTGILIVVGNLRTNNAPDCPFTGLVYVTGDWDEGGNRSLIGAVVVEGLVLCSGQACVTTVSGTGTDNEDKIAYDPFALYGVALDQFPASTTVEVVDGSWRQR